jgi:Tfp pilus assembly protein PilF
VDEAISEYRQAIALAPKDANAHYNLGSALVGKGTLDEAVSELRLAVTLGPRHTKAHYTLGLALGHQGKLDEAAAAYRRTIAIDPEFAKAHCNLGHILQRQGRLTESLKALRLGHALGVKRPVWPYPSRMWVRQAERLVRQEKELPDVLSGKRKLASASESITFAELCTLTRRYQASVRLYADAFTIDSTLADDLQAGHRYNSACAAALAGAGQGNDSSRLDARERARLRKQALDWLRADLVLRHKQLQSRRPGEPDRARAALTHWQKDSDLAGIRDAAALARLPAEEQRAFAQLWADVAALLKQARVKPK